MTKDEETAMARALTRAVDATKDSLDQLASAFAGLGRVGRLFTPVRVQLQGCVDGKNHLVEQREIHSLKEMIDWMNEGLPRPRWCPHPYRLFLVIEGEADFMQEPPASPVEEKERLWTRFEYDIPDAVRAGWTKLNRMWYCSKHNTYFDREVAPCWSCFYEHG